MILKRLRWVYDIKADIRSDVARDANTWLTHMEEYAYRNVHYSNTFITFMPLVRYSCSKGGSKNEPCHDN